MADVEGERWIVRHGDRSGSRAPVGVLDWSLPTVFESELDHSSEPFRLGLTCHFSGERVEVKAVTVKSTNGRSITPRDLSAIELARAVYLVSESELQPELARHWTRREGRRPEPDELRLVASIYGFQYAAWGNPRQAVMGLWGLPRATANNWIRKARSLFPVAMPGEPSGGTDE